MSLLIRLYQTEDFDAVTLLWRRSREESLPEIADDHTFDEDRAYFQNVILQNNQVWIAKMDRTAAGFMAIHGSLVNQLYIDPDYQHRGIGQALLAHARSLSPEFLRLYTLQVNKRARIFYEKNGFRAVKSMESAHHRRVNRMWNINGHKKSRRLFNLRDF